MKRPLDPHKALKEFRQQAGLTQSELAEKVEITDTWYRTFEKGLEPTDEMKRRLAAALHVSVWAIWPNAQVPTDRFRVLLARHGQELEIPASKLPLYKEVVFQMDEDEFEALIESGRTVGEVHKIVKAWARTHDIEVPVE